MDFLHKFWAILYESKFWQKCELRLVSGFFLIMIWAEYSKESVDKIIEKTQKSEEINSKNEPCAQNEEKSNFQEKDENDSLNLSSTSFSQKLLHTSNTVYQFKILLLG